MVLCLRCAKPPPNTVTLATLCVWGGGCAHVYVGVCVHVCVWHGWVDAWVGVRGSAWACGCAGGAGVHLSVFYTHAAVGACVCVLGER